jgi:hypothetical protein
MITGYLEHYISVTIFTCQKNKTPPEQSLFCLDSSTAKRQFFQCQSLSVLVARARDPVYRQHKPDEHECRETIDHHKHMSSDTVFCEGSLHEQICLVFFDTACDPTEDALRQHSSEFAESSTDAMSRASVARRKNFCGDNVGCCIWSCV